jgi:hypothetical protein
MLDTGIGIPEVVNLVFMTPVHPRIKLWQMTDAVRCQIAITGRIATSPRFRVPEFGPVENQQGYCRQSARQESVGLVTGSG